MIQLRISLAIRLIFSALLAGCASLDQPPAPAAQIGPLEGVYEDSFDNVWRATQIALQNYPMHINNVDKGLLQTDLIKSDQAWRGPHQSRAVPDGYRYKLTVRAVKGRKGNASVVRVSVLKEAELQKDFFAEPHRLQSDGMEERVILYRIGRELEIDQALQRAQKKMSR